MIEEDGFRIQGLVSVAEDFYGVNIQGTDDKWNDHNVFWSLKVWSNDIFIGQDSRKLRVSQLRSLGSLGSFYPNNLREKVIQNHRIEFSINVYLPVKVTTNGDKILSSLNLENYPLLGVYFSAHWCGPCCHFTPILSKFYNEVNSSSKQIEIVFFSWDQDEEEFQKYFNLMPWKAITFGNPKIEELADKYNVNSIPTLLIFKNGTLVSDSTLTSIANCKTSEDYKTVLEKWNK